MDGDVISQNIYDDPEFFAGYIMLDRLVKGLDGAPEWSTIRVMSLSLQGENILDLGCGYGRLYRYARNNRAANVMGLDISQRILIQAHSVTQGNGIVYQRKNLEALTLSPNSLDLIYSLLALHYLHDIERLFVTIYQSLTPGGMLVFSAEHPIYTAPPNQGWIKDKAGQPSWPVNHYQQEGERIGNWFTEDAREQHRKLTTRINALIAAGFEIVCVDEWGPSAQQIAENSALDEEKERPMVSLLSACKLA